tara:strand:+ start:18402 stop:18587 length:186 start_codon:yes stop_codon:yes gene_type:complete
MKTFYESDDPLCSECGEEFCSCGDYNIQNLAEDNESEFKWEYAHESITNPESTFRRVNPER